VQHAAASAELLEHWADSCVNRLEDGQDIDVVKNWLTTQKTLVLDEPDEPVDIE